MLGGLSLRPIFEKGGGLTGSQFLVYQQKCFSVTTKNLNWEILTKDLVTFKRWNDIKDEKF